MLTLPSSSSFPQCIMLSEAVIVGVSHEPLHGDHTLRTPLYFPPTTVRRIVSVHKYKLMRTFMYMYISVHLYNYWFHVYRVYMYKTTSVHVHVLVLLIIWYVHTRANIFFILDSIISESRIETVIKKKVSILVLFVICCCLLLLILFLLVLVVTHFI